MPRSFKIFLPTRPKKRDTNSYLDDIVKPLCVRAVSEPRSDYLYFSAVIVIWHACDWLAHERNCELKDIRVELIKLEPLFRYIGAAANVNKHFQISQNPKEFVGLSNIMSSSQTLTLHVAGNYQDEASSAPQFHFDDDVIIDGKVLISAGLDALQGFWENHLI